MGASHRPEADAVQEAAPRAERAVAWLGSRDEAVEPFREALGELPTERDDRLARMGDVLQATAQGLGPRAAAVWAGIPEALLDQWLAHDAAFASAVRAAAALASAHGTEPGRRRTPAMIRVVILAMSGGASWSSAADTAGITGSGLRQLWRASPVLVALVDAARHGRSRGAGSRVPPSRRPSKPGRASPAMGYRLVRRDAPDTPVSPPSA
ncbi:hypothetical protein ACFU5Z_25125 [Streptomyces sp. NPDC057521]|uniref:hypothetical protein n=1 Tax=Streptomyces sp. NPDC057521 TaxID=3346156 RepID=UPI0036997039